MTGSTRYRITVRGQLGPTFADYFDGMDLHACAGFTVLDGVLADSSQLYGVLMLLRDTGLDLLELTSKPQSA